MSTFFRSLCSASLTDSCQKMARIEILAEHFCAIVEATFEFGALFHYGVKCRGNKEPSKSKQNIHGDQQFI